MSRPRKYKTNGKSAYNLYDTVYGNRYFIVAISVIIISVFLYLLSSRLEREFDNAEQVQFELRLSEMRSAVLLMQASLVAKDELSTALKYEGANPMTWFNGNVSNYLGEMPLKDAEDKPGNWVFDPDEKVIAYLPRENSQAPIKPKWLRFKVFAKFLNENEKDQTHRQVKKFKALQLKALK